MLPGYKTYLAAFCLCVATGAKALGWIDESQYQTIMAILGALGLAFLRAGVTKSGPDG